MPYLLLALGLALALYALFRFFLKAGPQEIKAAFLTALLAALALAMLFLAVTGRLPAALVLMVALLPFLPGYFRKKAEDPAPAAARMTRAEALKILGLPSDADTKAVQSAYKNLMKKVHPDQEGSDWMAAKLNEARDFLLNKK
jgi:hypothetical protein